MISTRKIFNKVLVLFLTILPCSIFFMSVFTVSADAVPFKFDKTITIINAWGAGSAIDAYAQEYIKLAEKHVDSNFVIEYKSGASGTVGMQYMKTQPADGNTILLTGNGSEIAIATGAAQGVEKDDYVGLALLASDQGCVAVPADSPFKSMQDIIDYARQNPGKLNCGSTTILSYAHFFAMELMKIAGIEFNYINYTNASEVNVALLGGNVDFGIAVAAAFIPYHKSGELRIIAQGFEDRDKEVLADIPTVYETPGLEYTKFGAPLLTTRMFVTNAGVPTEALAAWDELTAKVTSDPEWEAFVFQQGGKPTLLLSTECEKYTKDSINSYIKLYSAIK